MSMKLPEGAAFPRTEAVALDLLEKIRSLDGVKSVVTMMGFDTTSNDRRSNVATFIVKLKHWDERTDDADAIRMQIQKFMSAHPDATGVAMLPVAVVLAVPYAFLGAMAALWVRNSPNDIYFQIGLLVLIGLTAKNAILIEEFAAQKMEEGMSAFDAAVEAAALRLRPILMTSAAFVLGVVPLLLATGAGASARHSMGTGVFGGMLAATFISTIFVPVFFTWFAKRSKRNR